MARPRKNDPAKPFSLADMGTDDILNIETEEVPKSYAKPKEPLSVPLLTTLEDIEVDADSIFSSEGLLSKKEKEFYIRRRREYYSEFNLNKSSDIGQIHRVIMEEIIGERLYTTMLKQPDASISNALNASAERYQKALDSLGATRDKRLKNKETGGVSIADLSMQWSASKKQDYADNMDKKLAEEALLEKEQQHKLELQYGTLGNYEEAEKSWEEYL